MASRQSLEKRIERLRAELVDLDAALRMFRSDFKDEGRVPRFVRGPANGAHMGMFEVKDKVSGFMGSSPAVARIQGSDGVLHQIKLTYGHRLLRLHQHPASGGWAREAGAILSVGG
jgi:hypothetical protein